MTVNWRNRTVMQCTPLNLLSFITAVVITIVVASVLTYHFTKNAFNNTTINGTLIEPHQVNSSSPSAADLRLPTTLEPLHYDVTVKTYLPFYVEFLPSKNLTFDGHVVIAIRVLKPCRDIVLNMKNITLNPMSCCSVISQGRRVEIEQVSELERLEKVKFMMSRTLEKDEMVNLEIQYSGLISNTLGGLYQATYKQEDGKTKIAAVTQFEPSNARRMVPCFDEPQYKANWTVTVIHPKGTRAVSNGIESDEKEEAGGDWKVSKFATTPRMSSYLLAILVSEFDYIEKFTKTGVRFRVWSRPEAKNMTQYALDGGVRCLEFYEDYFGIKYPLEKQDMVALPDFSAGAMENWGLITYRENALLYDENLYGPSNKRRVAVVVAHELAHQWFGNLVTMQWWDDLWLNEGFATMVEYIGADEISNGRMRMKDFFLVDALISAFNGDAISSSHPLSFKIDKVEEVAEAFDHITYGKGGSVLVMLSALIGEENFKKSVTHYLKKFLYNNARASDLWNSFDEVVQNVEGPDGRRLKIAEFADQWTTQMGYPIVTVESFNSTTVKITQQRYKINQKTLEHEKYRNPSYGFKWEVPIWFQEGNQKVKQVWLKRDEPLYLHVASPNTPFVINADRHGFYRQNYDSKGWMKITKQLKENHEVFSPRTRNALISDVFAAALIDKVEYETAFNLLEYMANEKEFLPWAEADGALLQVVKKFGNEPESKFARRYMLNMLKTIYDKIDFNYISENYKDENLYFQMNRDEDITNLYCALGSRKCRETFKVLFDNEVMAKCKKDDLASRCVSIAAPLRANSYCYGVREGGEAAFEKVMELYRSETVQLERSHLLRALGCHNDVTSLKSLLLLALDRNASVIRLQDVTMVFNSIANNPIGEEFMFNFLVERWEHIYESLSSEHWMMESVISACALGIRSELQLEQLRQLEKNGLHANEFGGFKKAIEEAEEKLEWIKKHFRKLSDFFKNETSSN